MNSSNVVEAILQRDRQVVFFALGLVILGCWVYLLAGAGTGMLPHEMAKWLPDGNSPAGMRMADGMMMSAVWSPGYALIMLLMWWLMMIAMMLPSAAPMVLLHALVARKGGAGEGSAVTSSPYAATAAFVGGYLVIWGAFSAAAVGAQWALERADLLSSMMESTNRLLGAGLLIAAGLWQLTPLKAVCLRHCRSPISFLSSHWRPGVDGAFRMGLAHGIFCLGCCWFLMALLFYGGVMNLIWILGLALFVLIEKLVRGGPLFGKLTGVVLILWGGWLGITAS